MKTSDTADLIWAHWQAGTVMDSLPGSLQPQSRTEGYVAQAGLETKSAHPRAGWKIAATSAAGQNHIGVSDPLVGRLLVENLYDDSAEISIVGNAMRVIEPEFAFRFGQPVPARADAYSVDEVFALVSDLHLTIEFPDSRFADFATAGEANLIADNACSRELIVGPAVKADWRTMDLAAHPVQCEIAGRYTREGIGSNVLGDPREALAWSVNEISSLGIDILAGELITTGTAAVPLEIQPGDMISCDFGVLGRIGAHVAP